MTQKDKEAKVGTPTAKLISPNGVSVFEQGAANTLTTEDDNLKKESTKSRLSDFMDETTLTVLLQQMENQLAKKVMLQVLLKQIKKQMQLKVLIQIHQNPWQIL